jgi:hypothetical protein
MELETIFEIINTNPACYFVAGIVLGYVLRGFVLRGSVSDSSSKRPSRYQPKKTDTSVKRAGMVMDSNEPPLEWSDKTVKAFTSQRIGSIALDRHGNEFR